MTPRLSDRQRLNFLKKWWGQMTWLYFDPGCGAWAWKTESGWQPEKSFDLAARKLEKSGKGRKNIC